jgi:hypothetical protein
MKSRNEVLPPDGSSVAAERVSDGGSSPPRSMFILPSAGRAIHLNAQPRKEESTERHVRFDTGNVGLVDQGSLGHMALPFRAFRRHQMSPRSVLTHHFARSSDLESFRDRLSRFAARDWFRHKARKITAI